MKPILMNTDFENNHNFAFATDSAISGPVFKAPPDSRYKLFSLNTLTYYV